MTDRNSNVELTLYRYKVEQEQKWREECLTLPFISFPAEWQVQVIPPFGDAVVRFRVKLPSGADKSIYLDKRNSLGCWAAIGNGYWEVYPYRGDVGRCDTNDIPELLRMIADEQEKDYE
jgi:hypothetical protein